MKNCGNCDIWIRDIGNVGNCSKIGIRVTRDAKPPVIEKFEGRIPPGMMARTHENFCCIEWKEEKQKGPFSVVILERDKTHAYDVWQIKLGEAISPQLQTQSMAQEWCGFLNYIWSIKNIDHIDIAPLYRTIGSKMWLDSLSENELERIAKDIYPPLISFLWCGGYIDFSKVEQIAAREEC